MSKTDLGNTSGYTPVIDKIRDECGLIPAVVFGVIWRYCQMGGGACTASQPDIARRAGISVGNFRLHVKTLIDAEYITREEAQGIGVTYTDTGKANSPTPLNLSTLPSQIKQPTPLNLSNKESLLRDKEEREIGVFAVWLDKFYQLTGIAETSYDMHKAADAIKRMVDAGATIAHFEAAYIAVKDNYTIVSPASLLNPTINSMRKANSPSTPKNGKEKIERSSVLGL